jgi:predicted lipid-binding transport protein (Tim44 family)
VFDIVYESPDKDRFSYMFTPEQQQQQPYTSTPEQKPPPAAAAAAAAAHEQGRWGHIYNKQIIHF